MNKTLLILAVLASACGVDTALPSCASLGCPVSPSGSPDVWTPCTDDVCFCGAPEVEACTPATGDPHVYVVGSTHATIACGQTLYVGVRVDVRVARITFVVSRLLPDAPAFDGTLSGLTHWVSVDGASDKILVLFDGGQRTTAPPVSCSAGIVTVLYSPASGLTIVFTPETGGRK